MKKRVLGLLSFVYFFVCFFNLFTITAQAYIDPSVVTYVIQGVAGVLIALGAALTIFRHKIFAFFNKNKKNEEAAEDKIELKDVEE